MKLFDLSPKTTKPSCEAGFSILEVLAAIVLLSIVGLNVTYGTIISLRMLKRSMRTSLATELAAQRMEELAALDPSTLNDSYDLVETGLISDNVSFSRTTEVTVNSDKSVTVDISVVGEHSTLGGRAALSNTFAYWGKQ